MYRKGIRCQNEGKSLYHYDLPDFSINESRVIDSGWLARRYITKAVVSIGTKEIASGIMKNAFGENAYIESALEYYSDTWGLTMSQGWRDAIGDKIIVNADLGGCSRIQRKCRTKTTNTQTDDSNTGSTPTQIGRAHV